MISNSKTKILYEYDKPIIWNLSCFGNIVQMKTLDRFINILKDNHINIPIHTLHGSFMCKYNGGRLAYFQKDFKLIKSYIKKYNDLGIGIKLTFSNMNVHKEQFEEKEMRQYLDVLNETKGIGNGIICVNDDFAELVKKNYPYLELVASHVKLVSETKIGITDTIDYYNSKFDLYDIVVMNTFRAFDDEFLNKIKHPEKVEFIVNHVCATNCQYAKEHHQNIELMQKSMLKYSPNDSQLYNDSEYIKWMNNEHYNIQKKCSIAYNTLEKIKMQYINPEEINYLVNTFGINKFKIEGRDCKDNGFLLHDLYVYIINCNGPYKYLEDKYIKNEYINGLNTKQNNINKLFTNKIKLY